MREAIAQRLAAWCLLSVVLVPLTLVWLREDLAPERQWQGALKISAVLLLAVVVAIAVSERMARRWVSFARMLEQQFSIALSGNPVDLPELKPAEFESLFRAFRTMSDHVRNVLEHANLESSRREAILTCMAEGVLAVDSDMRVVFCNQAFSDAFSARTTVAEGRLLYELVREPALQEILRRVLTTGMPETEQLQLPTAASRSFEARALPLASIPDPGAVIVLHDITDIQNQEQLRKDLVADVSHELRTPLAAIRGYAETLLDGALEDTANNRRFIEIILSHAIRLNNIASDLLVLSELDSGNDKALPLERLSVFEIIESAVHSVKNAAALKQVSLHFEHGDPCYVMGYRYRLEQVFSNLLDNAVKFNREEGEVRVECGYTPDEQIQISVCDSGVGIASSDIKRIFERFYRVDKARSRPVGGTGLGLPIVKEVIDRMGGTVLVESQLGKGSKFTILLRAA